MSEDEEAKKNRLANAIKTAKALYVYGGLLGAQVAQIGIFDHRSSSVESYEDSFDYRLYKTWKDYPSLRERKIVHFRSGDNLLCGYFYEVKNPKALVLAVHGFTAMADADGTAYLNYFVQHGYDVLAIDLTASGRSEGSSSVGLHQSAFDVAAAEKFIHGDRRMKNLPLCLIGHSWGGYGVAASLNFDQSPKAVCEMSGFYRPDVAMVGLARSKAGPLADFTKWQMDQAIEDRSGEKGFLSAIDGINKAKETRLIMVHGDQDPTISLKEASIYSQKSTNRHIVRLLQKGKGHEGVWFTLEATRYAAQMKEAYDGLKKQYKKISNVPPDILEAFYHLVDKEKSSVLDETLFEEIDREFTKALAR